MRRSLLPLLALNACTPDPIEDVRRPCPGAPEWDPNLPVALRWSDGGRVELNEHVARRIVLKRASGGEIDGVPFAFDGGLGLCVLGGLPADTDLAWNVTDGSEPAVQEVDSITTLRSGDWAFHTAASGTISAPRTLSDCVNTANSDDLYDDQCPRFDSADAGVHTGASP